MADVKGDHNVVIEGVSDSTITLNINGEQKEVLKKLDALQDLLQQLQVNSIQSANNTYTLNTLSNTNFDFIVHQASYDNKLPSDLSLNLVTEGSLWVQSLKQELLKQNVSVGDSIDKPIIQKPSKYPGIKKNGKGRVPEPFHE